MKHKALPLTYFGLSLWALTSISASATRSSNPPSFQAQVCTTVLTSETALTSHLIPALSPHTYYVKSLISERLVASGNLVYNQYDQNRRIHILIRAKLPDGTRDPHLRGAEQFTAIIQHLGPRAKGIEAHWIRYNEDFTPSELTDNLDSFNLNLSTGMSQIEAAKNTWTGQQAIALGYTHVQIAQYIPESRTDGRTADYRDVIVYFDEP